MVDIPMEDPRAVAAIAAVRGGNVSKLQTMLDEDPDLATARVVDPQGVRRTLLHILADWPGHCPEPARTVEVLVRHGTDLEATVDHRAQPGSAERPLHWAASSGDVALIDALLDAGADIEAPGAIFTGGTPLSDAVVFAQWNAARRLIERGARMTLWQAAALGKLDAVRTRFQGASEPSPTEVTNAFWNACRGGHRDVAEFLRDRGAELNWIGHDRKTPLRVAQESGRQDLVDWLREQGAR